MEGRSRALVRSKMAHLLQTIQEESLSTMRRGRFTVVFGIIPEIPKNRDGIEEDGCCTELAFDISRLG